MDFHIHLLLCLSLRIPLHCLLYCLVWHFPAPTERATRIQVASHCAVRPEQDPSQIPQITLSLHDCTKWPFLLFSCFLVSISTVTLLPSPLLHRQSSQQVPLDIDPVFYVGGVARIARDPYSKAVVEMPATLVMGRHKLVCTQYNAPEGPGFKPIANIVQNVPMLVSKQSTPTLRPLLSNATSSYRF